MDIRTSACMFFGRQRLYLAVRCGNFGLVGNGGHAHHDQLSIELSLDGQDLIVDPGTYLYTALKERRNEYRGANAHFAPQIEGREPDGTGRGLFQMRDRAARQMPVFWRSRDLQAVTAHMMTWYIDSSRLPGVDSHYRCR